MDTSLDTKDTKEFADTIRSIIELLNLANQKGGFTLEEGNNIYLNINILTNSSGKTEDEVNNAKIILYNALQVAYKRGCYNFDQAHKIVNMRNILLKK
jgi:hypothetical protein